MLTEDLRNSRIVFLCVLSSQTFDQTNLLQRGLFSKLWKRTAKAIRIGMKN